jgi:DNA-binding Lrp family transcriptional regulator
VTLRGLDELDRRILHALQTDARRASSREVARDAGVSASTVRKRIGRLEDAGIVTGYRAVVDYERAGYQLHVQVVCTAPAAARDALATEALAVPGVVGVRALATGERNVIVTVVSRDGDDLSRIAAALDDLGLTVVDEELLRSDRGRPFVGFAVGTAGDDDGDGGGDGHAAEPATEEANADADADARRPDVDADGPSVDRPV